jgi:hypothetical protein
LFEDFKSIETEDSTLFDDTIKYISRGRIQSVYDLVTTLDNEGSLSKRTSSWLFKQSLVFLDQKQNKIRIQLLASRSKPYGLPYFYDIDKIFALIVDISCEVRRASYCELPALYIDHLISDNSMPRGTGKVALSNVIELAQQISPSKHLMITLTASTDVHARFIGAYFWCGLGLEVLGDRSVRELPTDFREWVYMKYGEFVDMEKLALWLEKNQGEMIGHAIFNFDVQPFLLYPSDINKFRRNTKLGKVYLFQGNQLRSMGFYPNQPNRLSTTLIMQKLATYQK